MRRVVCRELGPPDRLEVEDVEPPQPGRGHVRVDVRAAGVNYADALIVSGGYQIKPPLPFVPGSEVAGVVGAVGEGVDGWAPGDRVLGMVGLGGFAEHVIVDTAILLRLPDAMEFGQAAGFIQSYATMLFTFTRRTTVAPGETVLVLGAGGGIGLAAIDVARALDLRVVAAASSKEKLAAAEAMGADGSIAYEDEDLKTRARELSGGGVDVVVDAVGGRHAEPALRALRFQGRYIVLGFASGTIPSLPLNHVLLNNRTVVGVDWGSWAFQHPEDNRRLVGEALDLVAAGRLHPTEPSTYPLTDAGRALTDLLERRVTGKVVLVPSA